MAFTTQELWRLKYELGYPLVTVGALPYIDVVSIFDQVIAQYMNAGGDTTSTTTVAAASSPTVVSVTVADPTGFSAHDRIYVDVDSSQEFVSVRSISGSVITCLLSLAHSGTYPLTVDGGVARARGILRKLDTIDTQLGDVAPFAAGVAKADDTTFQTNTHTGGNMVAPDLETQRAHWRQELADTLGVVNLRAMRRAGAAHRVEVY